ncbi:hypothetical protein AAC387_Pa05g0565 [Persea americana]
MLSTAVMYKDVFFCLKQRDSSYDCMPSEEEWEVAINICKKLELFFNVTKLFLGPSLKISSKDCITFQNNLDDIDDDEEKKVSIKLCLGDTF